MTLYWKGYGGFPRMARVINTTASDKDYISTTDEYEELMIEKGIVSFRNSNYRLEIDDDTSLFYSLKTGDVISIDDRGVIRILYACEEGDACLFITGHCNSNCIMCPSSDFERRRSEAISLEWFRQYFTLLPTDVGHITITGGEPTLNTTLFFDVMDMVADKFSDAETLLLTNGRSFAAKNMVDRLVAHCPQYLRIAIPIHGPTPELHDKITRASGSFKETCMGIRKLLNEGIAIELRVVISKLNYSVLTEIADFIVDRFPSALVVNFIGLETRGSCAVNFNNVYVDLPIAAQAAIPAIDRLASAGVDAALYNFPLCSVDRGYWSVCKNSITPSKIRFPAGCDSCEAKISCGGFFNSTLSLAKPKIKPIQFGGPKHDQSF